MNSSTLLKNPAVSRSVRIAFSPDADDIFMFEPMLSGRVDTFGLSFTHQQIETESLNSHAESVEASDVCAVSIAQVPTLASRFLLLPHGASVGRGFGPVVVAKHQQDVGAPLTLSSLVGKRVAVPGLRTTAHLVLRLLVAGASNGGTYEPIFIPITPFSRVFEALDSGEVDAALLIHEGRLSYLDNPSLYQVAEIGVAWQKETGLPLPLGGNMIRRDLGPETIAKVSECCRRSIAWSLEHRDEVMAGIEASGLRAEANLSRARLDQYLGMYANQDSACFAADAVAGMQELFRRGISAGLLPDVEVEFAP